LIFVKDILPILQNNIPQALGAKEGIVETLLDEIKELPFIAKELKSAIKKISADELKVELSNDQLEWIKKDIRAEVKSYAISFTFILSGVFILLYEREYKDVAVALFVFGVARIFYK